MKQYNYVVISTLYALISCLNSISAFLLRRQPPPQAVPLRVCINQKRYSEQKFTSLQSGSISLQSFDSFDYSAHWYPVIWSQDVPLNQPIRVTLFDVDYVLAKTSVQEEEVVFYAMLDQCPHKKVALSEGRITDCGTSDKRYIQCSYHGWTFDGKSGQCMEIPQTVIGQGNNKPQIQANQKRRREDATAVATTVVQGMVWLQPSYTPLEALVAINNGTLLPPPTIPEMDMEGYKSTCAIRDFPIDWTVLTENILDPGKSTPGYLTTSVQLHVLTKGDSSLFRIHNPLNAHLPDHGYFAHSSSGAAKGFDWYSADGSDNVMTIDEEFSKEGGYKITSSVNAVEKLIEYNRDVRSCDKKVGKGDTKKESSKQPPKLATSTYTAPSLISLGRRTNSTSPSNFITAFWVCPVGAGRSRFMSAAVGKTPFSIPRWMVHINLNNFLDQDTFLLLGQHRAVLKCEAEGYLQMKDDETTISNDVRKSTYVYRSPSEKVPVRLGQFFDATLARVPNRREGVLAWYNKNVYNHKLLEPWPQREQILDRYEQHTKVCPDSMDVVKRCDMVIKRSKVIGFALLFMRMISASSGALSIPTSRIPIISAMQQGISRFVATLLQNKVFYSALGFAYLLYTVASRIKKEFFFKFNDELHRSDIKYIAKNWKDL